MPASSPRWGGMRALRCCLPSPISSSPACSLSIRSCSVWWCSCCRSPADPGAFWPRIARLLAIWAVVGGAGIVANIIAALQAERLAHRNRLTAMRHFFEHVLSLPLSFHGDAHSGRLMKTMLSGADAMFWLWLSFFRDQFSTSSRRSCCCRSRFSSTGDCHFRLSCWSRSTASPPQSSSAAPRRGSSARSAGRSSSPPMRRMRWPTLR